MEIWAVARFDLGLPDKEIGKLNLMEYDALVERKRASDNRERFNAGIIAAAIINSVGGVDGKAVSPVEFVPDYKQIAKAQEIDLTTMTPIEQRDYLLNTFGKNVHIKK